MVAIKSSVHLWWLIWVFSATLPQLSNPSDLPCCCYICTCICCLKLHQADYQVGEVFFTSILVGGTQLQCIYYLCRILISRPPRVFRRFKRRSCWLCSHHRIIVKFSGVITNDKSDVHAKGQGQRSKVKVTEVNTQLNRFPTVTQIWIHIWWWNDTYSLMMLRRGALLFFKVIRQISRSHGSKKFDPDWAFPKKKFDPDWAFPNCNSSLNSPMATKWCTKLEAA